MKTKKEKKISLLHLVFHTEMTRSTPSSAASWNDTLVLNLSKPKDLQHCITRNGTETNGKSHPLWLPVMSCSKAKDYAFSAPNDSSPRPAKSLNLGHGSNYIQLWEGSSQIGHTFRCQNNDNNQALQYNFSIRSFDNYT